MSYLDDGKTGISRRSALRTMGAGIAALGLSGIGSRLGAAGPSVPDKPVTGAAPFFTLPPLPYAYDVLEPHIDARTMEIHHTKHHQAYITNANKALDPHPELRALPAALIMKDLERIPESIRLTVRNNVGGHVNHTFFWQILGPKAGGEPKGSVGEAIGKTFGSFKGFQTQFADAAAKRFGSGWAWLVVRGGALAITSTPNQDSPLMEGELPVLGIDVWEHAYYLKYQNRRADYVAAFWNVVNWERVEENYRAALA